MQSLVYVVGRHYTRQLLLRHPHRESLRATPQARKHWMWAAVGFMLGQLAFFKYTNFVLSSLTSIQLLPENTRLELPLLIGISFFTFQSMSYIIDVYREKMRATPFAHGLCLLCKLLPHFAGRSDSCVPTLLPLPLPHHHRAMITASFMTSNGAIELHHQEDYISQNFVSRIFDNPALYSGSKIYSASTATRSNFIAISQVTLTWR